MTNLYRVKPDGPIVKVTDDGPRGLRCVVVKPGEYMGKTVWGKGTILWPYLKWEELEAVDEKVGD